MEEAAAVPQSAFNSDSHGIDHPEPGDKPRKGSKRKRRQRKRGGRKRR